MYSLLVLIAALKQRKKPNLLLWDLFVGNTKNELTAKFEVHTKYATRRMAPFVGKYVNGELLEREGATVDSFEPGKIAPFRRAHAEELLEQGFGQNMYGDGINIEEAAEDKMVEELQELEESIVRTEMYLLSKLLTTGVMPVQGKTIDRAITFGSINTEILAGDDLWTSANSDPIKYMKDKKLEVLKETGSNVNVMIMTAEASAAFQNHSKVADKLKYPISNVLSFDPSDLGNGATYVGHIPEIGTDIFTYADWVIDPETGEEVELIPNGDIICGERGMINVHYGAIAQKENRDSPRELFVMDRVPKVWGEGDNDFIRLQSAPLPVPKDVRGWYHSTVV